MSREKEPKEDSEEKWKEEKKDVALNWVDFTDGLIFSVSTYLSIIFFEPKRRGRKEWKRCLQQPISTHTRAEQFNA